MFDCKKKSLFVFSHPNHEVAVYGLMERTKPSLAFLTDGGGGARLEQTRAGVAAAGVTHSQGVSYFNCTEDSFYRAILRKDTVFFGAVAERLAAVIEDEKPGQILCDAVEYYNPIHDIALPVTLLAIKKAASKAKVFTVPLVYQASDSAVGFVFQRALPGQARLELSYDLSIPEEQSKLAAIKGIYHALMAQMGFSDEVVKRACRAEHIVEAEPGAPDVDPGCVIRYNERGQQAKTIGLVFEAITYQEHFLPLVTALLA